MQSFTNVLRSALLIALLIRASTLYAETNVSLTQSNRATYYVDIQLPGSDVEKYLLDTGAGYMTITETTLANLRASGSAQYLRDLHGIMADGSGMRVSLYLVDAISIGSDCQVEQVEVAVIPGATRGLLGLSALRKAAPFQLQFEPPTLSLARCVE